MMTYYREMQSAILQGPEALEQTIPRFIEDQKIPLVT